MFRQFVIGSLLSIAIITPAVAGPKSERKVVWGDVIVSGVLPADLRSPEGKTRWDLADLRRSPGVARSIAMDGSDLIVIDGDRWTLYHDPEGGDAAARWLLPDRDSESLRPGSRERIVLIEWAGENPADASREPDLSDRPGS